MSLKPIMVRVIELSRSRLSAWLGPASKLTRDPAFSRKQVARDGVTWTVRVDGERSRAHAELRGGRVTRFVVS